MGHHVADFLGTAGSVADRCRDLIEGRGGFLERGGLLFRAPCKVVGRRAHLLTVRLNGDAVLGDPGHRLAEGGCGQIEVAAEAFQFLLERLLDGDSHVTAGEPCKAMAQCIYRIVEGFGIRQFCRFAAAAFGIALLAFAFAPRLEFQLLDCGEAKALGGARHVSDLVATVGGGNMAIEIATHDPLHALAHALDAAANGTTMDVL